MWYWRQRADDRDLATSPQGNKEPLVVETGTENSRVSLGWARPWNVILSSFSAATVKKARCWFVGGDDFTAAVHVL